MHRLLAFHLVVVLVCLSPSWSPSTASAQDMLPPHALDQLGLTQAWARPVQVPAGAQSIADQQLFVHRENPREYVEIVMIPKEGAADAAEDKGKVLVRIPTDQVEPDGSPIGRKEAERLANNEIRRLKRRGIDAETSIRTVPRIHLYTIGTDGTLECRDAETGEPIWMIRLGDPRLPYSALGTSEEFITVINGANLIQVEAATGHVVGSVVPMPGAPRFGATNTGDFAMIPMIGGRILGYPLKDPTIDPFLEQVSGAALSLPTKSPDSSRTAWGTDQGYVYVVEMVGEPSVLFRLNTDGIVSGRVAAADGDRFYFGSESGQVYGVRATNTGKVLWSQPLGEPFYDEPTVYGDQVLLRSTYGNLFSLDVDDGHRTWNGMVSGVLDLLGAFDGRLYATSLTGGVIVLDIETGSRIASFPGVRPAKFLVNNLTDRLYLVSNSGDVQCIRTEEAVMPTFNSQPDENPESDEAGEAAGASETPATPFGSSDPFGAEGADPFGADGGSDPFGGDGGGADPFGGGDGAAMEDPFGGAGADPFGG